MQPELCALRKPKGKAAKWRKFKGTEISFKFEFLHFADVVPLESRLSAQHVVSAGELQRLCEQLLLDDPACKLQRVYSSVLKGWPLHRNDWI